MFKPQFQLHNGEGPIHTIKWRGSFIAWANDVGVKVYDASINQRIAFIDRPKGRFETLFNFQLNCIVMNDGICKAWAFEIVMKMVMKMMNMFMKILNGMMMSDHADLNSPSYSSASSSYNAFRSPRPDLYRCRLCWKDDNTLLIGWANYIRVCPGTNDFLAPYTRMKTLYLLVFFLSVSNS